MGLAVKGENTMVTARQPFSSIVPKPSFPVPTVSGAIRIAAGLIVFAALIAVPVPLLPPHRWAEYVQSLAGVKWNWAYLIAAVTLRSTFYILVGFTAAIALAPRSIAKPRLTEVVKTPLVVILLVFAIRLLKAGHLPVFINVVIPALSCYVGATFALSIVWRRIKILLATAAVLMGFSLWCLANSTSLELRLLTEAHLKRIVEVSDSTPRSEERFGTLLKAAFDPVRTDGISRSAVTRTRASILAFGVAVGDPRLATFIGLDKNSELMMRASKVAQGTTLRGREDWPRHYALSAALTVLENPFLSDGSGVLKEELDALTQGSGFSFGDLAADRAGIRFATGTTRSEAAANFMQQRIKSSFLLSEFFPPQIDAPENLTVDEFRRRYVAIGHERYRNEVARIDAQLDSCAALR